jgi:heat shock protein 4
MEVEEPIEGEEVSYDKQATSQSQSEPERERKRLKTTINADIYLQGNDEPKTRKVKKQVKKGDLPISSGTASLDVQAIADFSEKEHSMIMEDKLVADTEDKKNELEAYIYEMRAKIDEEYAEFSNDDEKSKLKEKLETSEVSTALHNHNIFYPILTLFPGLALRRRRRRHQGRLPIQD